MTDAKRTKKRAPGSAEFLIEFGAHVKRLREQAGLTQEKLSAMTGIDRIALSNIETGDRDIGASRLPALAAGLGVHPGDLFDL